MIEFASSSAQRGTLSNMPRRSRTTRLDVCAWGVSVLRCPLQYYPFQTVIFSRETQAPESRAGSIKPRATVEKGNPDWPRPSPGCPGFIKTVKKLNGGEFGSRDHRFLNDKSSCRATTTILQASSDHPKFCQLCNRAIGGTPTLGD